MPDYKFITNPTTGKYIISAPKRAKRPDEAKNHEICPFCPENLKEPEIYRDGEVVVISNKYPFAPIHEVIIHSSDHHKNFGELPSEISFVIFKTFRQRFQTHKDKGQVYIFHNRGIDAGESLFHPHSQLAVIPNHISLEIPPLQVLDHNIPEIIQNDNYYIVCPESSEWPDEVWLAPTELGARNGFAQAEFADATNEQLKDLSIVITKLVQALEKKLGRDFPYNFYIYPGKNWYLRIIPRFRKLGGFEVGTRVSVNTEDPRETIEFLKENL